MTRKGESACIRAMASPQEDSAEQHPKGVFATTCWNVVLKARDDETSAGHASREQLCTDYWHPIYAYVRRAGYGIEDAQDLTQEFFSHFLYKEWLRHLKDRRGKFRSFLLTFLKNFLSDHRDKTAALKRGGGKVFVSMDQFNAEERESIEPADNLTPDQAFDRRWLRRLNEKAIERLHSEYQTPAKVRLLEVFTELQRRSEPDLPQSEFAARLGISTAAFKTAWHRFQRRQAELLREEVLQTVGDPQKVDEELRQLMTSFVGPA